MIEPGMHVNDLPTPCLLVDVDRMEHSIHVWQHAIATAGASLRPHVKTHKVPALAQMQLAVGASGITVAKVAEAEVFAANGCHDIFIAYPVIGPDKWRRAAELARDTRLIVGVESAVGAAGLSTAATAGGVRLTVRVEVDLGLARSGVQPAATAALCQHVLSLPGLDLDGIFTFRSVGYPGGINRATADIAREEGERMVELAESLRAAGIPIRSVSAGSTPTARDVALAPGITEVRPGTYIFGDYMLAQRGVIGYQDIALSILCTVVSRPDSTTATVDGGSKTFCGDVVPTGELKGFARAVSMDAYLERMSEEHGVVRLPAGADPQIGDRIAFHPIHVCTTVNLADELIGIRDGQVVEVWPILARGKRT